MLESPAQLEDLAYSLFLCSHGGWSGLYTLQSSTETEESIAKLNHVIVAQTLFLIGYWLEADLFQGNLGTHDKSNPWLTLHFIDQAMSTEDAMWVF